jgi:hypothetical protein
MQPVAASYSSFARPEIREVIVRSLCDSSRKQMNLHDDPNIVRRDHWFADAAEVAPFLQDLRRQHPTVPTRLVSAALLQARKNLVIAPGRECLKREVSRILDLPSSWRPGSFRPATAA